MAQQSSYTQGYSKYTTATHEARTAEVDAAFVISHIKKTDRILDIGCGPGTITTGLAKYASEGKTIGLDISTDVLKKAKTLAAEANILTTGPGSVVFVEGNVLEKLDYPDDTFDIVYASQVFGHFPPPDLPVRALAEIRRVLKPGGVLATRDATDQHFYPPSLDLNRLWVTNNKRAIQQKAPTSTTDTTSTMMPVLLRKAGFQADKIKVGAGVRIFSTDEDRKFLTWRTEGQFKEGDAFRKSWLDAGITEAEIEETLSAVRKFAELKGAWFVALQGEMLAWK